MKELLRVAMFFSGLIAVAYGTWMVYRPAGVILSGVLALIVSLVVLPVETK